MVHLHIIEEQLKQVGANFRFLGRPEVRELAKILMPGEKIAGATNGFYDGGFAMLCVTDQRLLVIDKKPLFLTIEDVRFDMIAEIDFNHRLLNATVIVYSTNKNVRFTCWNHAKLREIVKYLQHRVMQIRVQHMHVGASMETQFAQANLAKPEQIALIPEQAQAEPEQRRRFTPNMQSRYIAPTLAHLAMRGSEEERQTVPLNEAATATGTQAGPKLSWSRRRKFPSFY